MRLAKPLKHKFTGDLNEKELKYRDILQPQQEEFNDKSKWIVRIDDGRRKILPFLYRNVDFGGEILDIGAGSCWFSSELSLLEPVSRIYCLDMSEFILTNISPHIMKHLGANTEKLVRVIGDFNKLYFEDEKFDFVVFDASLHHIPMDSYSKVLSEVHRVLKRDGKVVAIREPFLSSIPINRNNKRRSFGLSDKNYGVTENIFTKREWRNMFSEAGFKCQFIPDGLLIDDTLTLRNLIRKLIKYSPLRIPFFHFYPNCIIVLEKY